MGAENKVTFSSSLATWFDYVRVEGGFTTNNDWVRKPVMLESGRPFNLFVIESRNKREGKAVVGVSGNMRDLAQMPHGPLVRLHSACLFSVYGDNRKLQKWMDGQRDDSYPRVLYQSSPSSKECDCLAQQESAIQRIANEGGIYFDLNEQEGRGAGLEVKRKAYELQNKYGLDTIQAYEALGQPFDVREYGHCVQFLLDKGIRKVRLLTNNPWKSQLQGIEVTPVPLLVGVTADNIDYLRAKREAGHSIPEDQELERLVAA